MNVIKSLIARVEEYRETNMNPCKNYATEAAAERATLAVAKRAALHFARDRSAILDTVAPARYITVYIESWGRWVGAVDMTELLSRPSSTGGYLGVCGDFFTY